ncbi:ATP-binding protein [Novipirellula artificiosorum]|uniref:ATP-binding protein n=1 Tax=Novipirellula artificiosorum TaxID=2528016 RepID=UPI0021BC3B8A|nr:ATP-binding protein [Novipirellula artificiosorum]
MLSYEKTIGNVKTASFPKRALRSTTFPTDFMLIAAANPCPCGYRSDPRRSCNCLPTQIEKSGRRTVRTLWCVFAWGTPKSRWSKVQCRPLRCVVRQLERCLSGSHDKATSLVFMTAYHFAAQDDCRGCAHSAERRGEGTSVRRRVGVGTNAETKSLDVCGGLFRCHIQRSSPACSRHHLFVQWACQSQHGWGSRRRSDRLHWRDLLESGDHKRA